MNFFFIFWQRRIGTWYFILDSIKKNKTFRINATKEQVLFTENHKVLLTEMKIEINADRNDNWETFYVLDWMTQYC